MLNYFQGHQQEPIMGLSLMSSLQQTYFFKQYSGNYILKQIGSKIVIFKSTSRKAFRRQMTEAQAEALKSKKFSGSLSKRSQKKIVQICQNWQDTLDYINDSNKKRGIHKKRQIVLLTLTLSQPQHTDDRDIKRYLLVPFLQKIIRLVPDINYLWKAEPQKNGNIHFHILIDRFIEKETIQLLWNKIQYRHGYHPKELFASKKLGAPSTRIEGLRSKNNAVSYMAKYISKNEGERPLNGRLWGCNNKLKELLPIEAQLSKEETLEYINNMVWNSNQIHVEDFHCVITNAKKDLLKSIVSPKNYTWDIAIKHNIDAFLQLSLHPEESLYDTEFYQDIIKEYGMWNTTYLKNNNLLFDIPPKPLAD
jgi:hypothetical protein